MNRAMKRSATCKQLKKQMMAGDQEASSSAVDRACAARMYT